MLDFFSLGIGVALGLLIAKVLGWVSETRTTAQRSCILSPRKEGSLQQSDKHCLKPQKPFKFFEAALGNAIYKHRVLGYDSVGTRLMQRCALKMYKKYREPCSTAEIVAWAKKMHISPTGWDKDIEKYRCIDEFFVRKPKSLVIHQRPDALLSPAEGTVVAFSSISLLKTLWVKQKAFSISGMGVPDPYVRELEGGTVMVFKLDVHNVHRMYAPVSGRVVARVDKLEPLRMSHSIRPVALQNGWSIFTENRRVMLIIENEVFGNVAMMIVGGIAVDTIEMEESIVEGCKVEQGQELGRFHMGGSAVVLVIPKHEKFCTRSDIAVSSLCGVEYEVKIGDVLTDSR